MPTYYEICPFPINYGFVMFYSTGLMVGSGPCSYIYYTKLDGLVKDEYSNLLQTFVNCRRNKFYVTGPKVTGNSVGDTVVVGVQK
jgi:hypothetical protein